MYATARPHTSPRKAWRVSQLVLRVMTNFRLGQAYHSLGQYPRAMDCLRPNLELISDDLLLERMYSAGLPSVFSRIWLALCLAELGEFAQALAMGDEAFRTAETGDPGYSLALACVGLGNVHLAKGDFDRAVTVLERGMSRDSGEPIERAWPFLASALGAAYTHLGRAGDALPLLEQAVERAGALKLKANQSLRMALLAEALLKAGGTERAFTVAAQALDLAQEHRERGHEAHIQRLLASIELGRDTPALDQAESGYRTALALAGELGMRPLEAHCRLGLGRVRRRTGDPETATTETAAARDLFRLLGMTSWADES